ARTVGLELGGQPAAGERGQLVRKAPAAKVGISFLERAHDHRIVHGHWWRRPAAEQRLERMRAQVRGSLAAQRVELLPTELRGILGSAEGMDRGRQPRPRAESPRLRII